MQSSKYMCSIFFSLAIAFFTALGLYVLTIAQGGINILLYLENLGKYAVISHVIWYIIIVNISNELNRIKTSISSSNSIIVRQSEWFTQQSGETHRDTNIDYINNNHVLVMQSSRF